MRFSPSSVGGTILAIAVLCLCRPAWIANVPQGRASQKDVEEERLVARSLTGGEEERLDALVNLGAYISDRSSTGGARASASTVASLLGILQSEKSALLRSVAAKALELIGDSTIVPSVLDALKKERNVAVRKAIIYALARYPSSQTSSALVSLLNDRNKEVRGAAGYALAEVAEPSTEAALIETLRKRGKEDDQFLRREVARALGRIRASAAREELLRALTRDQSQDVRREAARSLGLIARQNDSEVLQALRAASLSQDPFLSSAADQAISAINERN